MHIKLNHFVVYLKLTQDYKPSVLQQKKLKEKKKPLGGREVGSVTLTSPPGASVLFQGSLPLILSVYLDFLFNVSHCSESTGYDMVQLLERTSIISMIRM